MSIIAAGQMPREVAILDGFLEAFEEHYNDYFHPDDEDANSTLRDVEAQLSQVMPLLDKVNAHMERIIPFLNETDFPGKKKVVAQFRRRHSRLTGAMKSRMDELAPPQPTQRVAAMNSTMFPGFSFNQTSGNNSTYDIDVKLPKIGAPEFDGKPEHWLKFRDLYISMIHQNPKLDNARKFQYLEWCIKIPDGQPNVLKTRAFSAATYEEAWKAVCDRYDDKKMLVRLYLQSICDEPKMSSETAKEVLRVLDVLCANLSGLEQLGYEFDDTIDDLANVVLVHLGVSKLHENTLKEWKKCTSLECVTWGDFKDFMNRQQKCLDDFGSKSTTKSNDSKTNKKSGQTLAVTNNKTCPLCSEAHTLINCKQFASMTVDSRRKFVGQQKLCFVCLVAGHHSRTCKTKLTCEKCTGRHNTILHFVKTGQSTSNNQSQGFMSPTNQPPRFEMTPTAPPFTPTTMNKTVAESSGGPVASTSRQSFVGSSMTLLAREIKLMSTVMIDVLNSVGDWITLRALLDGASNTNYITTSAAERLGLTLCATNMILSGIAEQTSTCGFVTTATVRSKFKRSFAMTLECSVLDSITSFIPCQRVEINSAEIPKKVKLADPSYDVPQPVDMLLDNEVFLEALMDGKIKMRCGAKLVKTKFGWIVGGKVNDINSQAPRQTFLSSCPMRNVCLAGIEEKLDKFISAEEYEMPKAHLTPEAKYCEELFQKTTSRDPNGRVIVELPLKSNVTNLGHNMKNANMMLHSVERLRKKDDTYDSLYREYMCDYISSHDMEEIVPDGSNRYYLPHHGVLKMSSTSTKLRPVCNGSSKSETGLSLNDVLCVGPVVQRESYDILMNWREYPIVLMGDVTKMYRQVWVHPAQRHLLSLLWRDDMSGAIKHYQFSTVPFGISPAPYLATRSVVMLARTHATWYPEAADLIENHTYVDDGLYGAQSVEHAKQRRLEIQQIFASGGMTICKWISNSPEVLAETSSHLRAESSNEKSKTFKALGIVCDLQADTFSYDLNLDTSGKLTKAKVLSEVASIYDPIGWIGPVVFMAKTFMQKLWLVKLDWKDELPSELKEEWECFRNAFQYLNDIKIPRHCYVKNVKAVQIHGFSDASVKGYGSIVYVRSESDNGDVEVHILTAKSRVAPKKQITLARLELCGAVLMSQLVARVKGTLKTKVEDTFLWSDSTIVLHWISMESTSLHTYVGNRVSEIQNLSRNLQWRHIRGENNPADVISRGLMPDEMKTCDLWFNGPQFLPLPPSEWPVSVVTIDCDSPPHEVKEEMKRVTLTIIQSDNVFHYIEDRFSNYDTLVKVFAWIGRFTNNSKSKEPRNNDERTPLTVEELESAELDIFRVVQKALFHREYEVLKAQRDIAIQQQAATEAGEEPVPGNATPPRAQKMPQIPKNSKIASLMPFMDRNGIIRVGGRLHNSKSLTFHEKHQVILPVCKMTERLIRKLHEKHLHPTNTTLLNIVRQLYWPVRAKKVIRKVRRFCYRCFRFQPDVIVQLMATLPEARVNASPPFLYVAVDYAGFYWMKSGTSKNAANVKAYVAVFKCMATGAIHLELAEDLSTKAFFDVLDRFVARRGLSIEIFSDNATCFEGADNELRKIISNMSSEVREHCLKNSIKWNFTTPRAPHAGGYYESAVKAMKHHLKRLLDDSQAAFTFQELTTILCQIEAILNSRPLTPMTEDPNDLEALTPGHFLVGRPLTARPQRDFLRYNTSYLDRWSKVQQIKQQFWHVWHKEYLNTLQERPKKFCQKVDYNMGDMVLIREPNLPPMRWLMGRIVAFVPANPKTVRDVIVKTTMGLKKKHVNYLCKLPMEEPATEAREDVPDGNDDSDA